MIAKITKNVTVKIVQVDSNHQAVYGETVAVQSSVGPLTIYLPKPKENSSISIYDGDGNASIHQITVDAGSYLIDGYSTLPITSDFGSVSLISDGNFWKVTSQSSASGEAGGDLSGNYPNPTVEKIKNKSISDINPAPGQALVWTGVSWAPANVAGVSGSAGGFVYYLNYSVDGYQSPSGVWKEMALEPSASSLNTSTVTLINSSTYYTVAQFVSPNDNPNTEIIPGGIWDLNIYLKYDGNINDSYFRVNAYTWDGVTKTTLATSGDVYITNPSQISVYTCSVRIPTTAITYSDRIAIDIEAARIDTSSQNDFYAYFEGSYVSHIHTTIEAPGGTGVVKVVDGIFQTPASLINNDDVSATAGIDGSKITEATASNLGVIKLNGDLDGYAASPKVIAIQNQPISSGVPTAGERLTWTGSVWESQGDYTFTDDITVSLSSGKTLGRYTSGETIPATGKTPAEVIQLLAVEPISPTVSLTSSTTVQFNQTAISNVLDFSHVINSLGATVASASLEFRRGGAGSWTTLSTSTASSGSYTHTLTDSSFNTNAFNYRYTVTDSVAATNSATFNITPAAYAAPTISLSVAAASATSPETNLKREKGNVSTNLSGTITRNSPMVNLVSYTLQYQVNGGAWSDIGSAISISGASASITLTNHNPTADITASTIGYRVKVVDSYGTTYSSTSTISFLNVIFYGPSATAPTNSSGVRALGSRIFTDGSNPFTLNTGSTQAIYTAAMPVANSITEVLDLDALNANITASYVSSTFNVNDAGGTATSYKVYTMTNSIPYSSSHRHQITRS